MISIQQWDLYTFMLANHHTQRLVGSGRWWRSGRTNVHDCFKSTFSLRLECLTSNDPDAKLQLGYRHIDTVNRTIDKNFPQLNSFS